MIGRELVMEHTPAMGVMQEMEQGQGTTMAAGEITVVVDFYPAAEDLIVFLPCMEGQALKVSLFNGIENEKEGINFD